MIMLRIYCIWVTTSPPLAEAPHQIQAATFMAQYQEESIDPPVSEQLLFTALATEKVPNIVVV